MVAKENGKPGTTSWQIAGLAEGDAMEGYASAVSAVHGDTVTLYVSTAARSFHVEAYRMSWYGGAGGRLVWMSEDFPGKRQSAPTVTPGVNLVEARWDPSVSVSVDSTWPPGCYVLKLVAPVEGVQRWVPLTVRDDESHSAFLMMNAVSEWQAYNEWGGYSLYFGRGVGGRTYANRGRIVSYDRPYSQTGGAGDFVGLEFPWSNCSSDSVTTSATSRVSTFTAIQSSCFNTGRCSRPGTMSTGRSRCGTAQKPPATMV